jgi:hypothetical protein
MRGFFFFAASRGHPSVQSALPRRRLRRFPASVSGRSLMLDDAMPPLAGKRKPAMKWLPACGAGCVGRSCAGAPTTQ